MKPDRKRRRMRCHCCKTPFTQHNTMIEERGDWLHFIAMCRCGERVTISRIRNRKKVRV